MPFLRTVLLLLGGLLPTLAVGQTYFNERYLTPPRNTVYQLLSDGGTGWWVAGGCDDARTPGNLALSLLHLDETGSVLAPGHLFSRAGTNYFPGLGGALLPVVDGGMVLISASTDVAGTGSGILWRFTAQGDTLWTRTYAGLAGAELVPRGGCRLSDGGYALVGEYYDPTSTTSVDVLLLRTDSLGHELWRRTYHQDWFDTGKYVLPTADGGWLISGATYPFSPSTTEADGLLLKVDSLGQEQWRTTYGGSWVDLGGPVLPTTDGGYVVGGTSSNSIGPFDQWETRPTLFWFDSAGTLLRERAYGPGRMAASTLSFLPLTDGGYLLAGQTADTTNTPVPGGGYPVGFLLRVCADGDSVWYRTYRNLTGGYSHNYLRDVKQAPDGGFVGAGFLFARAPDTGPTSAWVFKTDADGYLQAGGAPPVVVCTPVGLTAEAEAAQTDVWPNPAPDGRFTLALPSKDATERVAFTVTDAVGRQVLAGVLAGAETALDLCAHPAGVYGLRLTWSDGRSLTRRLIK